MNKMLRYLSDYKLSVLAPLSRCWKPFDLFVPLVMADIVNVGIAAHDFHYILRAVRHPAASGHRRPRACSLAAQLRSRQSRRGLLHRPASCAV